MEERLANIEQVAELIRGIRVGMLTTVDLEVTVTGGEFWDAPASPLVRLVGLVRGALTGAIPNGGHGEVDLQH